MSTTEIEATLRERFTSGQRDILSWLLVMPLLDRHELSVLAEWSPAALSRYMTQLTQRGLVGPVKSSVPGMKATSRFYLTQAGIEAVAEAERQEASVLLRRHSVSAHWLRLLVSRLDAIPPIYALVTALSDIAPIGGFRWYRKHPLDAALEMEGGGCVGVVREGATAPLSHLGRRVWFLRRDLHPETLLVLAPDPMALRHWRRVLERQAITVFLAVERQVLAGDPDSPIWYAPSDPQPWTLRRVAGLIEAGSVPAEQPPSRLYPPPAGIARSARELRFRGATGGRPEDWLLPAVLDTGHKRVLDLIARWPWTALPDMQDLLGVTKTRTLQLLEVPLRTGLVLRHKHYGRIRYVLSDRGLKLLARRDRLAVPVVLHRWSPSPLDPDTPVSWQNMCGSRLRQLARHAAHTTAVQRFLGLLARQAREHGMHPVLMEPQHRAARRYQWNGANASFSPDAYGLIRGEGQDLHFFLEWERRAGWTKRFLDKLSPYLDYYASGRPLEDFGAWPHVLFVFPDEIAEAGFLRVSVAEVASRELSERLPVCTSTQRLVEGLGPVGAIWRGTPGGQRQELPLNGNARH